MVAKILEPSRQFFGIIYSGYMPAVINLRLACAFRAHPSENLVTAQNRAEKIRNEFRFRGK